jgi:hypothetical protein
MAPMAASLHLFTGKVGVNEPLVLSLTKMRDVPTCGQVLNTPYSCGSIS